MGVKVFPVTIRKKTSGSGNVAWTPGDSAHPPSIGAQVLLPSFAIQANNSIGVHPTIIALALGQGNTSIGVTAALKDVAINSGINIAGHAANSANAVAGNNSIACSAANPANAIAGNNAIAGHISGTVIGAPFWQSVTTANLSGAASKVTVNVPAGTVNGDLLLAFVGTLSAATSAVPSLPSGWTASVSGAGGSANPNVACFWRIAASEPASYDFNFSASADKAYGEIHRIIGTDPTTPINTAAISVLMTSTNAVGASVITVPTVATGVTNCLVFCHCIHDHAALAQTHTPPASHSEKTDYESVNVTHLGSTTDNRVFAATGTTGTATVTCTESVGTNYFALRVAIAPGTLIIGA